MAERALPKKLEIQFIITDESVNRKGWRLLVDGVDLEGFLKNPVCCVQHSTWSVPIGRWENVGVSIGKDGKKELVGTLVFDRNDEEAVKLYWKYVDGFMSAVSLNIYPIEESDDAALLLPGQKFATVKKSELLEISVVTIPGQKNAVKLSFPDGGEYHFQLSINTDKNNNTKRMEKNEKNSEQYEQELAALRLLNAENLIERHKQRGVVEDGEVEPLKKLALSGYEDVSSMLAARTPKEAEKAGTGGSSELALAMVTLHANRGAITDTEKAIYLLAAEKDYEGTKKLLEEKVGKDGVSGFINRLSGGKQHAADEKLSFYELAKTNPARLEEIKKENPELYAKLLLDFSEENKRLGIHA